jgi:esterase
MIILHGLLGMSDNWIQIAKQLADRYEIFIPDLRNHGLSPHSDEMNFDIMCEDIHEFLNDYVHEKTILLGHSMGGKIAMMFADRFLDLIEKLIIIDISPLDYSHRDMSALKANHLLILNFMDKFKIHKMTNRQALKNEAANYFKDEFIVQLILKNVVKEESAYRWKVNVPSLLRNIRKLGKELKLSVNSSKTDALFLFGKESPYFSRDDYFSVKQYYPNAKLTVIPKTGHNIHIESRDELISSIISFLNS